MSARQDTGVDELQRSHRIDQLIQWVQRGGTLPSTIHLDAKIFKSVLRYLNPNGLDDYQRERRVQVEKWLQSCQSPDS